MSGSSGALPGMADRAVRVEVRDADGRLLRVATPSQADRLVMQGAGEWFGYGRRRHVRVDVAASTNSLHVTSGYTATAKANPGARYRHNDRACSAWQPPPKI